MRPMSVRRTLPPVRSVRVRIIGWVLAIAAVSTLALGITAYTQQLQRVETRTTNAINQEVEEFSDFLRSAGAPWTSRDFPTLDLLFETAERGNVGGRYETFIGLTGTTVTTSYGRATGIEERPDIIADLAGRPDGDDVQRGSFVIDGNEIRYAAIPVTMPGVEQEGTYVIANSVGAQRDEARAAAILLVVVALVGLSLLAGIGWWLSGRLLRPVRLLNDAITQVSATDFSQRIPTPAATTSRCWRRPLTAWSTGSTKPSPPSAASWTTRVTSSGHPSRSCAGTSNSWTSRIPGPRSRR